MDLKQAFQTALDFKQKGYAVYWDMVQKTKNYLLKKTFAYLAEQEMEHIEKIENTFTGDSFLDIQTFFNLNIKEFKFNLKISQDDLKVHEIALVLEQNSYEFYEELLNKIQDEKIRKFLLFLMEQENAHYELIQRTYEYLKDPVNFYISDEKWNFDGG